MLHPYFKKLTFLMCLALFLGSAQICFANLIPRALATDSRIKVVAYNPDDVVTVTGSPFINTAIQFSDDEIILSIQNGDAVAWETTVDKQTPNVFYVKPKLPASNTNMAVMTNKHHYDFHLLTRGEGEGTTYRVEFKYPEEERAAMSEALKRAQRTFMGGIPGGPGPIIWNYRYSFYGAPNIAPIEAVDNGTFTIFKFRNNSPMPAIFSVDRQRNEALVNFRVQGSYVFIQGVRRQYTLRNGADVTTIYNDCLPG